MMQLHYSGSMFLWLDQGDPRAAYAIYGVHGASIFADRDSMGRTIVSEQWSEPMFRPPIPNVRPQLLWDQAGFAMNNPAPVHRSPLLVVIPLVWGVVLPPIAGLLLWIDWAKVLMLRNHRTRGGTLCEKCLYARAGLSTDAPCPECGAMPEKAVTPPKAPE